MWGRASSVAVLVAANLVPLAGVAWWNLPLRDVIFLYWMENLVVGVCTSVRMFTSDLEASLNYPVGTLLFIGLFFWLHYGLFCWFHFEFLVVLFPPEAYESKDMVPTVVRLLRAPGMQIALAAIVVGQAYASLRDRRPSDEKSDAFWMRIILQSYLRIVVVHVFIIAGGAVLDSFQSPLPAMVAFVAIKGGLEAFAYLKGSALRKELAA